MRRTVVLAGVLLFGAPAHAAGSCDLPARWGRAPLPQPVYVKGVCGTLALRPDGRVTAVHPRAWAPAWAKHALARAGADTYITHPHRHLVLLRAARTLWRSRLAHGSDNVVVHGDALAFTAYRRAQPDLWVARLGAGERLAAHGEDLDGWARSGGFFTRHGRELLLRDSDGRLVRRLLRVTMASYDAKTETMVAVTPADLLVRSDGHRSVVLARLRLPHPSVWVLEGGLIELTDGDRLLLLRPDGTRFASAAGVEIVSNVLPLAARVVFVSQRRGFDRVLVLDRGHRVPRVLYEGPSGPRGCGYWANLSQIGDDVLYWPSTGRALVAVDAAVRTARDLWPLVHRLPGFRGHGRILRAAWSSAWNG